MNVTPIVIIDLHKPAWPQVCAAYLEIPGGVLQWKGERAIVAPMLLRGWSRRYQFVRAA